LAVVLVKVVVLVVVVIVVVVKVGWPVEEVWALLRGLKRGRGSDGDGDGGKNAERRGVGCLPRNR